MGGISSPILFSVQKKNAFHTPKTAFHRISQNNKAIPYNSLQNNPAFMCDVPLTDDGTRWVKLLGENKTNDYPCLQRMPHITNRKYA